MMVSAEMKDKTKGHSDSNYYQGGPSDKKRGRRLRHKWWSHFSLVLTAQDSKQRQIKTVGSWGQMLFKGYGYQVYLKYKGHWRYSLTPG